MKRSVKVNLFPKKAKGELVESLPIRLRVSYNGNRVDLRVGYSIEPEKWTGHSDYKAMKPYIKIVDALKVSEMERFDNFEDPSEKKRKNKK